MWDFNTPPHAQDAQDWTSRSWSLNDTKLFGHTFASLLFSTNSIRYRSSIILPDLSHNYSTTEFLNVWYYIALIFFLKPWIQPIKNLYISNGPGAPSLYLAMCLHRLFHLWWPFRLATSPLCLPLVVLELSSHAISVPPLAASSLPSYPLPATNPDQRNQPSHVASHGLSSFYVFLHVTMHLGACYYSRQHSFASDSLRLFFDFPSAHCYWAAVSYVLWSPFIFL